MIEWIVSSSVLIVVVALVRCLFKGRMSLRLQYALWALVLIRLLVPVSFGQSKFSVLNAVEERQTAQITVDIPPSRGDYVPPDLAPVEPDPALPTEEQEEQYRQNQQQWQNQMDAAWEQYKAENTKEVTISVPDILRIVWYAGMAAMALCLLWVNLSFRLRLRRSRRPLEGADCPLPVYVTGAAETPCLFGLIRPAVYVTPEAAETELVMGHVLAHEYTHYRHGDHLWSALRCLCLVLHWYNPLVWLAASLSRRDGELACDEGTLRRIGEGERLAYGRTLISLTCARRGGLLRTATTMTGGKGSIRERITLIAKKPKMAVYTLIAVLLIAAVAVGCTFTGAKGETEEPPAAGESVTPGDPEDGTNGPSQALAELGAGGEPLSLTLYTAGHGAWKTVDITHDRVSGIFDGPVGTGTAVECPSTAPSDYWLTLASADGKRSMTLWSGEEGLVQYSDGSGTGYWSLGGGEYCAVLLRQRYNQRVQSPDQMVFYAQDAQMAAERFPLLFCQMHMEYPTGHLFRSTDYRLLGLENEAFSADGNAVSGQMKCALLLESDLDIHPKDRVYQYQGWVIYNVRFSLGLGEDGLWHGVDWSVDFISFEEHGYQVPAESGAE